MELTLKDNTLYISGENCIIITRNANFMTVSGFDFLNPKLELRFANLKGIDVHKMKIWRRIKFCWMIMMQKNLKV